MAEDGLRYDTMLESALRSVVQKALSAVADGGLPGEHHFFVTFRTDHAGVALPGPLRARYPEEMTIVLQHRFWDLEVGADSFGVTLSFNDVRHRLTVPFAAITRFEDPSVNFGLQFKYESAAKEAGGDTAPAPKPKRGLPAIPPKAAQPVPAAPRAKAPKGKRAGAGAKPPAADAPAEEAGKVVALDQFRKK